MIKQVQIQAETWRERLAGVGHGFWWSAASPVELRFGRLMITHVVAKCEKPSHREKIVLQFDSSKKFLLKLDTAKSIPLCHINAFF